VDVITRVGPGKGFDPIQIDYSDKLAPISGAPRQAGLEGYGGEAGSECEGCRAPTVPVSRFDLRPPDRGASWVISLHGRMARGSHGLPKVSPGPAMPYTL
jgi:hypothetical protein